MMKKGYKGLFFLFVMMFCAGCAKGESDYKKAMELAEEKKYEQSLPYFEEAIAENKECTQYYIGYGMALNKAAKYAEAKKQFEKGIQDADNRISEENNKQLHYGMAMASYGLGEYSECITHCEKALEIDYFEQIDADIMYTKALGQYFLGNTADAVAVLEKLIEENTNYYEGYYLLAKLLEMTGQEQDAVKIYETVIAENPDNYDACFGLYELYRQVQEDTKAESILDRLIVISSKKAANLLVIGRAYYYKEDMENARQYMKMAAAGNCSDAVFYLGILDKKEKNYEEAVLQFEEYIEDNGENAEVYNQLAECYMEMRDYEKAKEWICRGLEWGNTCAVMDLRRNEIILYEKEKNYKEAKKLAKEYLALYPADVMMQKELEFMKTR